MLDVDVADRCRAPVESLAATYTVRLDSSALDRRRPAGDHLGQRRAGRGPARARGRAPSTLALAEAGRHATRVQVLAAIQPGELHPSAALPLALDERLRLDPVDGVTPLDVQQLERPG